MTLAIKTSDGVLWVGGVRCNECERDVYMSSKTGKCTSGHQMKYKPVGVKVLHGTV